MHTVLSERFCNIVRSIILHYSGVKVCPDNAARIRGPEKCLHYIKVQKFWCKKDLFHCPHLHHTHCNDRHHHPPIQTPHNELSISTALPRNTGTGRF